MPQLMGAPLSWLGEQWLREMETKERESGWFERKRSQSIHGQHNNRQWENSFESDPPPSFYSFSKGFQGFKPLVRALATFLGLQPLPPIEAWKLAGNNKKGFSPINVPNQPVDCLVQGILPVYGPATVGQSNKTKALPVAARSNVNFVIVDLMYDMQVPN